MSMSPRQNSPEDGEDKKYVYKYCSNKYKTMQALGGHQNAHKLVRSLEKAKRNNNVPMNQYSHGSDGYGMHSSYFPHPFPPYANHGHYHFPVSSPPYVHQLIHPPRQESSRLVSCNYYQGQNSESMKHMEWSKINRTEPCASKENIWTPSTSSNKIGNNGSKIVIDEGASPQEQDEEKLDLTLKL
ncbi:hypothetical protein LIER_05316 [Lithospermum erythrorhizon]|uniref:Uncharacterized protein n=1 Tax=Lithospermum erythrorhizon TaxID=34254 RepID=A0AAV3P022_LITER